MHAALPLKAQLRCLGLVVMATQGRQDVTVLTQVFMCAKTGLKQERSTHKYTQVIANRCKAWAMSTSAEEMHQDWICTQE
jgi:hypothetical protein